MRAIQVSTPVFAAIWATRLDGEDTEDAILARMLKVKTALEAPTAVERHPRVQPLGFHDERYGFHVDEGFEIFRRYKGKEYRAKASRWKWLLESNGKSYDSLSDLSRAIGAVGENAWGGWLYRPNGGAPVPVGTLRDAQTVQKRTSKPRGTLDDLQDL